MKRLVLFLLLIPSICFGMSGTFDQEQYPDQLVMIPATHNLIDSWAGKSGMSAGTVTRASARTRVNPDSGLIETVAINTPAFEAQGLHYSPGGTNLITYSEDFSEWGQQYNATTPPSPDQIGPDGTLSAFTITDDATITSARIFYNVGASIINGAPYCFSTFLKQGTAPANTLTFYEGAGGTSIGHRLNVDIVWDNGVPTLTLKQGTGVSSENVGNGWYKISVYTNAIVHTGGTRVAMIYPHIGQPASPATVYIFGAQLTATAFPLPYIPTNGSAVSVARDDISWPLSAALKNILSDAEGDPTSEGTLVVDWVPGFNSGILAVASNIVSAHTGGVSLLYLGTGESGKINTTDSTTYKSYSGHGSFVRGDAYRVGISWSKSLNELNLGVKKNGSWGSGAPSAYDGAFVLGSTLIIGNNAPDPFHIRNIRFFNTAKTQAWIEANF